MTLFHFRCKVNRVTATAVPVVQTSYPKSPIKSSSQRLRARALSLARILSVVRIVSVASPLNTVADVGDRTSQQFSLGLGSVSLAVRLDSTGLVGGHNMV